MAKQRRTATMPAVLLILSALLLAPPPGICQPATATTAADKALPQIQLKTITTQDLKTVIGDAAQNGELNVSDAQELISKINDLDTLMKQFDFIQEQERKMISSVGSSFH